jgi:hypothetical protein
MLNVSPGKRRSRRVGPGTQVSGFPTQELDCNS